MKLSRVLSRSLALLSVLAVLLLTGCATQNMGPATAPAPKPAPQKPAGPGVVALVVPAAKNAGITALVKGAEMARDLSLQTSTPMRVQVIRAEGNWIAELNQLPENSVIGGPLNDAVYWQMRDAGIMDRRVVFAFMPRHEDGDEGITAWRFFPSLGDQMDAVVRFAVDDLKISEIASFGPSNGFGLAAADLLEQKLAERYLVLRRIDSTGDSMFWSEVVKPYVSPTVDEYNGTIYPNTQFEAVFVAESWKNLGDLTSGFAMHGEERLVFLGSMLWDGFGSKPVDNPDQYTMVAYPTAFLRDKAPEPLASSEYATFWGALGYDFVRFAARLTFTGRPDARYVTSAARQASTMPFSMAPISYDNYGVASQTLFMVQPSLTGPRLADPAAIKFAAQAAALRLEDRVNAAAGAAYGATEENEVMLSKPQPSDKLSLPGAR